MPPVNPAINSFVAGEISPLLAGRTDLEWYKSSCARARDMVTLIEGGATRRPGSRFIAMSRDNDHLTILKSFIFSQGQARMLEFANKKIAFFANKGQIVNPDATPVVIGSDYQAADLRGLKFEQSADVLFIFHTRYPPKTLSRHSDTDWRLADMEFTDGPYLDVNADNAKQLTPTATSGSITITASATTTTLFAQQWSQGIYPIPNISMLTVGLSFSGDTVNLPAGTAAVATGTALNLSGAVPEPLNDADGATYYWISTGALTGKLAATAADAQAGTAIHLSATPVFRLFKNSDVGRIIRLGGIATNWTKAHAYSVGDIVKNTNQGVYKCTVAGTSENVDHAGPTGTGVGIGDGTVTWDYVNAGGVQWGYARITAVTSVSSVTANVITPLASAAATYYWQLGAYSGTTGYPACGKLHQQRMAMAGTLSNPDRLDLSRSADYGNFTPGDTDDAAISETLGLPTVDPIYWLASKRTLFLGTEGGAQKVYGSEGYDSPLTDASFVAIEQVRRGSADIEPVRAGNGLIFVHRLKRKLSELYYDFTQDLDTATELSARARHIITTGIVDIAYQEEPYSIIWGCTGAGQLFGVTYYRDQQVLGWHLHTLAGGGFVESVETMPGDTSDQLWLTVRRTVNGSVRRYIEVLDDFNGLNHQTRQQDLAFLDAYLVYDGVPATRLHGLAYLEGMMVQVLGDGAMLDTPDDAGFLVAGGAITLPVPVSKAYVGLDYSATSVLRPSPLMVPQPDGAPLGDKSKVTKVKIGLFRSGAFRIGPDGTRLDTVPIRTPEDRMDTAEPLFTGPIVTDPIDDEFTLEANVEIRPIGPLPLTVLWAVPHLMTQAGS